jgi:hypothetical protein
MNRQDSNIVWPALPLERWQETYATLHRWCQIVGKTCLALAPFENHWWHTTLRVSARGLRTPLLLHDTRSCELEFDFIDSALHVRCSDGRAARVELAARSVADFFAEYSSVMGVLGLSPDISPTPSELPDTTRFDQDTVHCSYDPQAVRTWWRILRQTDRLFKEFRSRFYGKCSPSHFWWGAFDHACTRFSGRRAPPHPGGIPHLSDRVTREAYSHECISVGWWPGTIGGPVAEPAFYAYAYPEPPGCPTAHVEPAQAHYHAELHEWILPYDRVRSAPDPDALVRAFLQSTYVAASGLGNWPADLVRDPPA